MNNKKEILTSLIGNGVAITNSNGSIDIRLEPENRCKLIAVGEDIFTITWTGIVMYLSISHISSITIHP